MTATRNQLAHIASNLIESYDMVGGINHPEGLNLPSREQVVSILRDLLALIFPGYWGTESIHRQDVGFHVNSLINSIYIRLRDEIEKSLIYDAHLRDCEPHDCQEIADRITVDILDALPGIRTLLKGDVQAAYDGDPAAKSHDEIILSYPCVEAIATYRIAHELYGHGTPLIPRILSEHAHRQTGIDIHPGATIGEHFFIDHGTGVVIGETAIIGNDVKLYQGVTLGALSFRKDPDGRYVKGGKRHPTIEHDVVIYSGATILGGNTVIGHGCVIGANVWMTSSIPPGTKVTIGTPHLEMVQQGVRTA